MAIDNELRRKALLDSIGAMGSQDEAMPRTLAVQPQTAELPTETDTAGPPIENTGVAGTLPLDRVPGPMDASNGGINGAGLPTMPGASAIDTATGASTAPAGDFSRLMGYDKGKFDANKDDAKYQMGRVLSQFDPRQGITPDVLAALNGLGYGNFSGTGQNLSLSGLTDKGRQANLQGDYNKADFIGGYSGGNGKWTYADPVEEAKQAAQGGGGGLGPIPAGGGNAWMDAALNGDPLAKIQQIIQQLSGSRPNFDALLAQLGRQ